MDALVNQAVDHMMPHPVTNEDIGARTVDSMSTADADQSDAGQSPRGGNASSSIASSLVASPALRPAILPPQRLADSTQESNNGSDDESPKSPSHSIMFDRQHQSRTSVASNPRDGGNDEDELPDLP